MHGLERRGERPGATAAPARAAPRGTGFRRFGSKRPFTPGCRTNAVAAVAMRDCGTPATRATGDARGAIVA